MVVSRKSLSIPGGRLMVILIPWKAVVIGWSILAAMLWVGYVGFSVLEGKNPFAAAQRPSHHLQIHGTADNGTRAKSNLDSR